MGYIVTLITGGGFIGVLLFREKKRAAQLENEDSASKQWQRLYERSDEDSRRKDEKIDELYRENGSLRDKNNCLTTENAVLHLKKCEVNGCSERKPPRGY